MKFFLRLSALIVVAIAIGCDHDIPTVCCTVGDPHVRVVNAFTTPVDVLIDGAIAIQSLAPSTIGTASPTLGAHTLVLRPTSGGSVSQSITTTSGVLNTIAAVRTSNGVVNVAMLDDTGSIVPAGATKVRVLHLAPNAGEIQVYRTQPDFQQLSRWQFPFTYQSEPTSLSAPFFQSTVGTWEIHAWQTPADASGWASAPVKVVIQLGSGEKKTVIILDNPGGGIRAELI
ncbi:MAG TPA: DUF4397 domain-containing protein [Gemmatimonadaceae bacterium]|jgi:hypothetical protein|nr:DUF4397 domain-containing protein [Gemmatimonadaceae bacterium]